MRRRGLALITALLATVLVLALLGAMVDVGSARLRQSSAAAHAEQALAAADAGTSWVRALLTNDHGDFTGVLADLATAHSTMTLSIDSRTQAASRTRHRAAERIRQSARRQSKWSPRQPFLSTGTSLRRAPSAVSCAGFHSLRILKSWE